MRPPKIFLYGKRSNRTPLAYDTYKKLAQGRLIYATSPEDSDMLLTGFCADFLENMDEIKKLKDDMAAREADMKSQCEQRVQKLTAQNKQQVESLNARIADLNRKKEADKEKPAAKTQPAPRKRHVRR